MFLFFLDASGDSQVPHPGATGSYVLGGLAIPSHCWPDVANHLATVKQYYGLKEETEVKWRHIYAPYDRGGQPSPKQPLLNMPRSRREKLAMGILDIVQKRSQLVVFATVAHKHKLLEQVLRQAMPSIASPELINIQSRLTSTSLTKKSQKGKISELADILMNMLVGSIDQETAEKLANVLIQDFERRVFDLAFSDILNNLEAFLLKAPALHSRQGLVINDEQASERENRYARDYFRKRVLSNSRPILARPLVECLSLVPSHHSVGIQVADFCMGAIGLAVSRGEMKFADIIEPNINRERRTRKLLGLHTVPT